MPRIIYYGGHGNKRPSGGLETLLQHVRWLRQGGFDSFLQIEPDFSGGHYDLSDIRLLPSDDPSLPDDIAVYPEPDMRPLTRYPLRRNWVFCQNHHYIFNTAAEAGGWESLGLEGVICSSSTILDYVRQHYPTLRAEFVPYSIDTNLFRSAGTKRFEIAYMPRKRGIEAKFIRGSFERRYPELGGVGWVEIDSKPPGMVAQMLANAAIFLSLGRIEGFGLPPVEAMAAGAIVVGFSGGDAVSYATDATGLWARPDDFDQLLNYLALTVVMVRDDYEVLRAYRAAGMRAASRYSQVKAKSALVEHWTETISHSWHPDHIPLQT